MKKLFLECNNDSSKMYYSYILNELEEKSYIIILIDAREEKHEIGSHKEIFNTDERNF